MVRVCEDVRVYVCAHARKPWPLGQWLLPSDRTAPAPLEEKRGVEDGMGMGKGWENAVVVEMKGGGGSQCTLPSQSRQWED